MNTQKIQASKNVKGFTLVELIVVITILAILGTIAFLSLQGQSAAARDSKRKTDLSSLSSKITIAQANGTSVLATVATLSTVKLPTAGTFYIGGAAPGAAYDAGTPNYTALALSSTDFKDPKGQEYRLGATTLAGGVYQLAATLEADNAGNTTPNALVVGTYSPRLSAPANTVAIVATAPNTTTLTVPLPTADIGKFKTNDTLTAMASNCTAPAKVTSVSSDLGTLTLSCTAATAGTLAIGDVVLNQPEGAGLVGSGAATPATPVTIGSSVNLPY